MQSVIHHEGLVLRPLTAEVIARKPDLDPVRRDREVAAAGRGWIDFEGRERPVRLIRQICRADDDLYYWDGPWGALSGSCGIAVVRNGVVVDMFTVMVS